MKALTIWQPWATFIVVGGKPYEFRGWDCRRRGQSLIGQRIAIHAGTRPMRGDEVLDIITRLNDGTSALVPGKVAPVLSLINATAMNDWRKAGSCLPLAAVLGTAILGEPVKAIDLFKDKYDSDRLDHAVWAWPLTEVFALDVPVPFRGAQGFWEFPASLLGSGRNMT